MNYFKHSSYRQDCRSLNPLSNGVFIMRIYWRHHESRRIFEVYTSFWYGGSIDRSRCRLFTIVDVFFFSPRRFGKLLGFELRPSHFVSVFPSRYSMGRLSYWQHIRAREIDLRQNTHKLWPTLAHSILAQLYEFDYGWNSERKGFLMMCSILLYDFEKIGDRTRLTKLTVCKQPPNSGLTMTKWSEQWR